jgi:hypothetical protein
VALEDRLISLSGENNDRCPVQRLLDSLPEDTTRLLADLLADQNMPTYRLHQALRAEGIRMARDTISNHRSGRCYCRPGGSQ